MVAAVRASHVIAAFIADLGDSGGAPAAIHDGAFLFGPPEVELIARLLTSLRFVLLLPTLQTEVSQTARALRCHNGQGCVAVRPWTPLLPLVQVHFYLLKKASVLF